MMWWPLIIFVALAAFTLVAVEMRERKNKVQEAPAPPEPDSECCGQHLVCERLENLKNPDEIEYFDDEELDEYANMPANTLSQKQIDHIRYIFETLSPRDVQAWVRSLQMRNIALPDELRDEVMLILTEQRDKK